MALSLQRENRASILRESRDMTKAVNGSISFGTCTRNATTLCAPMPVPGDFGYNFGAITVSHALPGHDESHIFRHARDKMYRKTKWILNLNLFFASINFSSGYTHIPYIFPGIVHRFKLISFDANKIDKDEENGRKCSYRLPYRCWTFFSFPFSSFSLFRLSLLALSSET